MSVNKARRRPASSARSGAVRVKERLQEPLLHAEGAKRLDPKTVPTAFIAGGRKPRIILMAALGRVYAALEYRKIEAVIPPLRSPHRKGAQGFGTERFKFDPRHDVVRCPAKKRLTPPRNSTKSGKWYRADRRDCARCPLEAQCLPQGAPSRRVHIVTNHASAMPTTATTPSTNSPLPTCPKSNAADGTASSTGSPRAQINTATQNCLLERKEV